MKFKVVFREVRQVNTGGGRCPIVSMEETGESSTVIVDGSKESVDRLASEWGPSSKQTRDIFPVVEGKEDRLEGLKGAHGARLFGAIKRVATAYESETPWEQWEKEIPMLRKCYEAAAS